MSDFWTGWKPLGLLSARLKLRCGVRSHDTSTGWCGQDGLWIPESSIAFQSHGAKIYPDPWPVPARSNGHDRWLFRGARRRHAGNVQQGCARRLTGTVQRLSIACPWGADALKRRVRARGGEMADSRRVGVRDKGAIR